ASHGGRSAEAPAGVPRPACRHEPIRFDPVRSAPLASAPASRGSPSDRPVDAAPDHLPRRERGCRVARVPAGRAGAAPANGGIVLVVEPLWCYAVHGWEADDEAVYARSGWV